MTAHIIKTFTLEGFDLTYNGTISQETFDEVTSGSFVKQGYNLLIVGGNGTGKTSIANCAVLNAQERGHTCEKLWTPSTFMPHDHLVEQDIAIGHLGDGRVHYRSHLIDADVLVVEDTQNWLEICPVVTLGLLGLRAERGKSNVLIFSNAGWLRACEQKLVFKRSFEEAALQTAHDKGDQLMWPRTVFFGGADTIGKLLQAMGIDIDDPALPTRNPARHSYPLSTCIAKPPAWRIIHTGERSYR